MKIFAEANNDSSFLYLDATVQNIVIKRFSRPMKIKFSEAALKASKGG